MKFVTNLLQPHYSTQILAREFCGIAKEFYKNQVCMGIKLMIINNLQKK